MRRRSILTGGSAAFVTAIAGCLGGDDESTDDESGNGEEPSSSEGGENGADEPIRSDDDTLLSIGEPADIDALPFAVDVVETFEGTGSAVTDEFELESGLAMLVYESENVGDEGLSADVERTDGDESHVLAINEVVYPGDDVGEITGATLVEADGGEYLTDIDTGGQWTVHVAQPRAPDEEIRTLPVSASGEDSQVVGPIDVDAGMTVAGEHVPQGDEENYTFNVRAVAEDATDLFGGDYAFTEDGGFEGEARVDVDGVVWVEIRTRGEWHLEFEG